MADSVVFLFEQIEQLRNRLASNGGGLEQVATFVADSIDTTVNLVTGRVSQVVLHVTDDRVLPVCEVDAPIRSDFDIGRAEVRIGGEDDRLNFGGSEAGVLLLQLVLQDPLEADHVVDQDVASMLFGEMAAAEDFGSRTRPRSLLINLRRIGVLVGKVEVAGEQQRVSRLRSGSVPDDVLTPAFKDVAVRIGETERDIDVDLLRARLVAEDAAVSDATRSTPRRFDLRVMEGALLHVERSARVDREAIDRVVCVGRVEAVNDPFFDVVLVVAVGVLEEQQVRALSDQHAAVPELETGGIVDVSGECLADICFAVVVGVFEDQQLVVHRIGRSPMRIGRPCRDPQAALRVERHLHGIDQFRKHRFVGEEFDLHVFVNGHLLDRLLPGEVLMLASRQRAGLVGDDRNQSRDIGVIRLDCFPLSRRPNHFVAIRGLHIEDVQLTLPDRVIRQPIAIPARPLGELQKRSVPIGREAVGHAVAVEPVEVFVEDCGVECRQ